MKKREKVFFKSPYFGERSLLCTTKRRVQLVSWRELILHCRLTVIWPVNAAVVRDERVCCQEVLAVNKGFSEETAG